MDVISVIFQPNLIIFHPEGGCLTRLTTTSVLLLFVYAPSWSERETSREEGGSADFRGINLAERALSGDWVVAGGRGGLGGRRQMAFRAEYETSRLTENQTLRSCQEPAMEPRGRTCDVES